MAISELKLHPCYCGGKMKIEKVSQDGGMDGMYWDWKLTCRKCGLTSTYAADGFYGRKYKTFGEVVEDWNKKKEKFIKNDVLDKIRAEIEAKCCITVGRENDGAITLHDVFEILDKYKAESE